MTGVRLALQIHGVVVLTLNTDAIPMIIDHRPDGNRNALTRGSTVSLGKGCRTRHLDPLPFLNGRQDRAPLVAGISNVLPPSLPQSPAVAGWLAPVRTRPCPRVRRRAPPTASWRKSRARVPCRLPGRRSRRQRRCGNRECRVCKLVCYSNGRLARPPTIPQLQSTPCSHRSTPCSRTRWAASPWG